MAIREYRVYHMLDCAQHSVNMSELPGCIVILTACSECKIFGERTACLINRGYSEAH